MIHTEINAIDFSFEMINSLGESEIIIWLGDRCDRLIANIDLERKVILYNNLISKSIVTEICDDILEVYDRTTEHFTFRANSTSQYFNTKEDFKELEEF